MKIQGQGYEHSKRVLDPEDKFVQEKAIKREDIALNVPENPYYDPLVRGSLGCGTDTNKLTFSFKSICFLTQRSSATAIRQIVPQHDESTSDYALTIAAWQAFDAPTTVKHTNGLMAYMIWFWQHGQL